MSKVRIIIQTPLGTITGKNLYSEEDLEPILDALESAGLAYLSLDTWDGKVILRKGVAENSIITLKPEIDPDE